MQLIKQIYHESISNVNNKSIGSGPNCTPFSINVDLETCHVILVKYGEGGGVTVGSSAKCLLWFLTWRVVVETHYGVVSFKEGPVVGPVHPQTQAQYLHYVQRQPRHLLTVLLVYAPASIQIIYIFNYLPIFSITSLCLCPALHHKIFQSG